jgi:hypothetical protein
VTALKKANDGIKGKRNIYMSDDLVRILTENDLADYISVFEQNKLNSIELSSDITESDYEKTGISALGNRKKLLKLFFKDIKQEQPTIQVSPAPVPTVVVEQKKTHGVWIFVGVLIAIMLAIGIVASLDLFKNPVGS